MKVSKWYKGAVVWHAEFKLGGRIFEVTKSRIRVRWYFDDMPIGDMSLAYARKNLTWVSLPSN